MIDGTFDRVVGCILAVFESKQKTVPAIAAETKLDGSLGLASLDYAELVVRLEDEFGFDPFVDGIPSGLATVADLTALYASR